MTGRVLVVGSANIDVVLRVDRLPGPGETVVAESSTVRGFGGKGANQAVAAALAGARVAMVGRVGDEALGTAYRERLAGFGIDVRRLLPTAGSETGTAYVTVDGTGENSIVVSAGANAAMTVDDLGPVAELARGDVLLVQCELPARVVAEAVRRAHGRGARVVLNLAPFLPLPADVIALADPVVVNEEEALLFEGAGRSAARPADDRAPGSLVVTRGGRGATWGELQLPAVDVPEDEVVDTTGAGDAFCGALAAALAAGHDSHASLGLALAAGADAVRRLGAQPQRPE